jgi:hypothetical protein
MVKKEVILAALNDLPAEVETADVLERLDVLGLVEMPILKDPNAEGLLSWRDVLTAVTTSYRLMLGLEPACSLNDLIDEVEADQAVRVMSRSSDPAPPL